MGLKDNMGNTFYLIRTIITGEDKMTGFLAFKPRFALKPRRV